MRTVVSSNNSKDRVFNYQKWKIKRKIWFAVLRHKSSIIIGKKINMLLDTIAWLESNSYRIRFAPSMHTPHFGRIPGVWIIEW